MSKLKTTIQFFIVDIVRTVITFILVLMIVLIGYSMGYQDGYTEGYVNNALNQYIQTPVMASFSTLGQTAQTLWSSIQYNILAFFEDKPETQISKEDNTLDINYEENASDITKAIQKSLSAIPTSIVQQFLNDDWQIVVQKEGRSLNYQGGELSASGITSYPDKTIYLESNALIASDVLLHEFGHYFDKINARYSEQEEWQQAYSDEWKNLYVLTHIFHDVDSSAEYFAEIFKYCLTKPELIQELCPQSSELMNQLLKNYL